MRANLHVGEAVWPTKDGKNDIWEQLLFCTWQPNLAHGLHKEDQPSPETEEGATRQTFPSIPSKKEAFGLKGRRPADGTSVLVFQVRLWGLVLAVSCLSVTHPHFLDLFTPRWISDARKKGRPDYLRIMRPEE